MLPTELLREAMDTRKLGGCLHKLGVKYDKYLERQAKEVRRLEQHAMARLPDDLDYAALPCLSAEEVEKLTAARPATLHDAGLIPGITPKAVGYLFGAIEQRRNKERLANKAKRDDAQKEAAKLSGQAEARSDPKVAASLEKKKTEDNNTNKKKQPARELATTTSNKEGRAGGGGPLPSLASRLWWCPQP